ncbi:MAG: alpha/beta hydrolase [Gemmatimonadota bacterium]
MRGVSLLLIVVCGMACQRQDPLRYIIYLHAKIVETEGRRPTDSTFGTYEYDAILDSLRRPGVIVLSDQRPPMADSDASALHVAQQVDSLLALGVPAKAITVIGFSKGGWIAILASARLRNPAISFVFMAACGPWAFERPELHVTGRLLSLYETSDSLGVSCAPLFEHQGSGSRVQEIPIGLGLGHGTFFEPRSAWLGPARAWAEGPRALPRER